MRPILWLGVWAVIYSIVVFSVDNSLIIPVQLAWIIITSLPLWVSPIKRWVFV